LKKWGYSFSDFQSVYTEHYFCKTKECLKVARRSESGWMNTAETAKHFAVTVMTITRWLRDPDLNFPQPRVVHNRNYFSREACDAWMEKRNTEKTVRTVRAAATST
jgi:hypothetical protein